MNTSSKKKNDNKNPKTVFPALVVKIIDSYKLVINRGSMHGVKANQRFMIYALSDEEIVDPETNQKLGYLEIVRGTGKVVHVQEKMATIMSDKNAPSEKSVVRSPFAFNVIQEEKIVPGELISFDNPLVGDKVKPI